MDAAMRCAGDEAGTARGLHAVESDGDAIDAVGVAAFDDWELALAEWAEHHVFFACHWFSVEVSIFNHAGDYSSMVSSVLGSNYCPHACAMLKYHSRNSWKLAHSGLHLPDIN